MAKLKSAKNGTYISYVEPNDSLLAPLVRMLSQRTMPGITNHFLLLILHGMNNPKYNEYGTHEQFADKVKNAVKRKLRGRSLLYISCWGGEQGVLALSKRLPGVPVVGCGSMIRYELAKKGSLKFISANKRALHQVKVKEEGADKYQHWVIGFNGKVADLSKHGTSTHLGVVLDIEFFAKECKRLKSAKNQ